MQPEEVLRQLVWRHDDLLRTLTAQVAGVNGHCRLLDASGQVVWSNGAQAVEAAEVTGSLALARPAEEPPTATLAIGDCGQLEFHGPGPVNQPAALEHVLRELGALLATGLQSEEEFDRLVEEHISNTNQLVALYNTINATHETWELSDKLAVMVDEVGRQTAASIALIHVEESGCSHFAWWPDDPELEPRARMLLGRVQKHAESVLVAGADGFAAAPISFNGESVGWLAVGERLGGDGFLQRDVRLIEALGELTGAFLTNARLQDRVVASSKSQQELEIARRIQHMLVPRRLPGIRGLDVAATCEPASQVGGDLYVVLDLPDGRCGFALGDVAGKGAPAALVMAMTRTAFRALAPHGATSGDVLRQVSEVLFDDLEEVRKFVTMVVGIFDPKNRTIQISNAGHSPVYYRLAPGSPFQMLEPLLPPLGVLPVVEVGVLDLPFPAGALLVAASDGITEARSVDPGMFGDERFLASLEKCENATAACILQQVLAEVRSFAQGAPQADDQTLLLLQGR